VATETIMRLRQELRALWTSEWGLGPVSRHERRQADLFFASLIGPARRNRSARVPGREALAGGVLPTAALPAAARHRRRDRADEVR